MRRRLAIVALATIAAAQVGAVIGGLATAVFVSVASAAIATRPGIGLGEIVLGVLLGGVAGGILGLRASLRASVRG
jgi:hypothetical protein